MSPLTRTLSLKGEGEDAKGMDMASVKKGQLTASPEWAKHLREWKRSFWHGERIAEKEEIVRETRDLSDNGAAEAE